MLFIHEMWLLRMDGTNKTKLIIFSFHKLRWYYFHIWKSQDITSELFIIKFWAYFC